MAALASAPGEKGEEVKFELDKEHENNLVSIFKNQEEKKKRLDARLERAHLNQERIEELRRKLGLLEGKKKALAEKAAVAAKEAEKEAATLTKSEAVTSCLPDDFDAFEENHPDFATFPKVPYDWWRGKFPYENKGPKVKGMVSSVFPDGQLFRIITDSGEWAFYNDSLYYDMHLRYVLNKNSKIKTNSTCIATRRPDGALEVSYVLHPEETIKLFSGTVNDFENLSKAVLLSEKYECPHKDMHAKQDSEVARIKSVMEEAGVNDVHAEAALRVCVNEGIPFVDVDFYPNHGSLYRPGIDAISIPTLPWKRPADYLPAGSAAAVHLMRGPISANVIRQGKYFADVQLISVLKILAEDPAVVKFLFYHANPSKVGKKERQLGAYRVQLCSSGWWTSIIVDNYFPASAHAPEFGSCGDDLQATWVSVIEKAYAKHLGSYSAVQLSPIESTFMDLTGCPCTALTSVWPSPRPTEGEVNTFVETLRAHLKRSGSVGLRTFPLSTAKTQEKKDRLEMAYKELGLQPGYGVRVLGLETVGKFTLLRIRQVNSNANGTFLDNTSKWLKVWTDAKKPWVDDVWSVVFGLDETSVLWMEAADVAQYFQSGFLYYPIKANAELRARGTFRNARPSTCIKVSVKKDTQVMFTVQQQDVLLAKERGSSYREGSVNLAASELKSFTNEDAYAAIGVQLYASDKKKKDKVIWVQGNNAPDMFAAPEKQLYAFEREAGLGATLTAAGSPYYIVPCVRDKQAKPLPYILSSFICKAPAKCGREEDISLQFVTIKESSSIFSHTDGKTAVLTPSTDVKVTETEFQSRWRERELMQVKKQSEFIYA